MLREEVKNENSFKTFSQWNKTRWETRGVKQWERQKAKGKWLFVFKYSLIFTLTITVGLSLFDYWVDGRIKIEDFWIEVPFYLILGVIGGSVTWNITAKKYQQFVKEKSEPVYLNK